ncbi:hypothetical protein BC832DRAFT_549369 [Gaertneriomyces semiglobifer]|nr:hypothetical protein BC832DRAFT_549369 [Gaertneriomyces semiglobifer]
MDRLNLETSIARALGPARSLAVFEQAALTLLTDASDARFKSADTEPAYLRPYLAIVVQTLMHCNILTPLPSVLAKLATTCSGKPELLTAALLEIWSDVDREIKRFHTSIGDTPQSTPASSPVSSPAGTPTGSPRISRAVRLRPVAANDLSTAFFIAVPWRFEKSAIPDSRVQFSTSVREREQFRCAFTRDADDSLPHRTPNDPIAPCDSAHIFPFGLRYHITRLSALMYPDDVFEALCGGNAINDIRNGIFMRYDMHRFFGKRWCVFHRDGINYAFTLGERLALRFFDTDSVKSVSFAEPSEPSPNPLLLNMHAFFAIVRARLDVMGFLIAGGERDDVLTFDYEPVRSWNGRAETKRWGRKLSGC